MTILILVLAIVSPIATQGQTVAGKTHLNGINPSSFVHLRATASPGMLDDSSRLDVTVAGLNNVPLTSLPPRTVLMVTDVYVVNPSGVSGAVLVIPIAAGNAQLFVVSANASDDSARHSALTSGLVCRRVPKLLNSGSSTTDAIVDVLGYLTRDR